MLFALLDGNEVSASELACRAKASAQSASGHLSKLVEGGLLTARTAGRQRLFRLASPHVASAVETLASIAPATPIVSLGQHNAMRRVREARSCYDHLAGRLGVAVTEALVARGAIALGDREFDVTRLGSRFLRSIGVDVAAAREHRRSFARACMDWTERRWHLAGSLGSLLLQQMLQQQWVRRSSSDRSLHVTPAGQRELIRTFGLRFGSDGLVD